MNEWNLWMLSLLPVDCCIVVIIVVALENLTAMGLTHCHLRADFLEKYRSLNILHPYWFPRLLKGLTLIYIFLFTHEGWY
jgi:hypothetical protein